MQLLWITSARYWNRRISSGKGIFVSILQELTIAQGRSGPLCKKRNGEGSSIWPRWLGRWVDSAKPVTLQRKRGSSDSLRHWLWKGRDTGLIAMWFVRELSTQNPSGLSLLT